jgi:hypothetical protein
MLPAGELTAVSQAEQLTCVAILGLKDFQKTDFPLHAIPIFSSFSCLYSFQHAGAQFQPSMSLLHCPPTTKVPLSRRARCSPAWQRCYEDCGGTSQHSVLSLGWKSTGGGGNGCVERTKNMSHLWLYALGSPAKMSDNDSQKRTARLYACPKKQQFGIILRL